MLKCSITSSPSNNYAGTPQSITEMLINKTVNKVILKLFSYSSAGQYERFLTISGLEGALQKHRRGKRKSRKKSLDI